MKLRLQWCLIITLLQALPITSLCPEHFRCETYLKDATLVSNSSLMYVVSCNGCNLRSLPRNLDPNVTHLSLRDNHISFLDEKVLNRLQNLEVLDLSSNSIADISGNHFRYLSSLRELILTNNPIVGIQAGSFDNLTSLHSLYLSQTLIKAVPRFTASSSIIHLYLDDTNIKELNPDSLRHYSQLEGLYLKRSKIKRLVNGVFQQAEKLKYLMMEYSTLDYIEEGAFDGVQLHTLSLQGTHIRSLPVKGLEELINLNLEDVYNLWQLHASQLPNIRHLLLTYEFLCCPFVDNFFDDTWEVGRQEHGVLQECKHTVSNHISPSSSSTIKPSKAEHFNDSPQSLSTNINAFLLSSTTSPSSATSSSILSEKFGSYSPSLPMFTNRPTSSHPVPKELSSNQPNPTNIPTKDTTRMNQKTTRMIIKDDFISLTYNGSMLVFTLDPCDLKPLPTGPVEISRMRKRRIICRPKPDDFNPCEDLLGSLVLRVCTWFISVSAVTGNLITLVVILLNRRKVSNHKLLMCTLALSSFCMGLYLFILAVIDAKTSGEYRKYVKEWQHGVGCKVAGFLSIFSTEVSVFILNIITLERYYTILFPLHQNKWMTVKQTTVLLVLSFFVAVILAALPLIGISSYTKVAICLPFDVTTPSSKAYVTFLLVSNGACFFTVLFAYMKMYLNIQHTARATFAELNVAKKMAVIVLTNFACWAPIAVFSIIAIYGEPLIDIPTSKFLMVFVLPINALTNPFLYFLITKRFRHDLRTVFDRCRICASSPCSRQRRESFRTSITRTTHRTRSRSSSGNSLISMFRRPPGKTSTDYQSSTPRHSLPRGSADRRSSILQRSVTYISGQKTRRESYVMAAKNRIHLEDVENIDDNMTFVDCWQNEQNTKNYDIRTLYESAC